MTDPGQTDAREDTLLYDWNVNGHHLTPPMRSVELHDETLRDGIQCPSVHDPSIEAKKDVVRLLSSVGVHSVNVGLPGAGPRAVQDSQTLVEHIRDNQLAIRPGCAARTHPNDIQPIIDITQATGVVIVAAWVIATTGILFYLMKQANLLRAEPDEEIAGLDVSEHGSAGYGLEQTHV